MKYIGAHVSAAGGIELAVERAVEIGACEKAGFLPEQILPHDSYLINLGHPEAEALEKSRNAFIDEMQRCE